MSSVDAFLERLRAEQFAVDPNNSFYVSLAAGTNLNSKIGFRPRSVIIDNNTSQYLQFPDAGTDSVTGRFVPPGFPAAFQLYGSSQIARALWAAPGGKVQGPTIAGEAAQLMYFANPIPPGAGVAQPVPSVQGTLATAFPSLSRGAATYNFDIPEQHFARGIVVFMVVTAGAGTVTIAIRERETTSTYDQQLLISTAIASGSLTALKVYPAIAVVANQTANTCISHIPRLQAVVAGAAATFVVTYTLLP